MTESRRGRLGLSPFLATTATLVGLFLLVPIVVIAIQSFSSSRFLEFPPPAYSLRWYNLLVADASWRDALMVSLQVASAVTLFATFLGTLAALGLDRWSGQGREIWLTYIITPMIMPSIVTAVGIFLLFSKMHLTETRLGLVLAHTILAIPLVTLSVLSSLQGLDHSLELYARTLGAGAVRAFRTVTLPLILPGILTGGVFAFITSFDELVIAMFVTGTRTVTLPKRMWDGIHYEIDPTVSAVSTLIVVFTSVLVLAVGLISRQIAKDRPTEGQTNGSLNVDLTRLTLQPNSEVDSK